MIYIASKLAEKLQSLGLSSAEFRSKFYDLISGYSTESDFFGRDVLNIGSENVRHVHIIPDKDDPQLKNWVRAKSSFSKTSDNLLFYTKFNNDYLLISIVKPNGHEIFKNSEFLSMLEEISENFILRKIIP